MIGADAAEFSNRGCSQNTLTRFFIFSITYLSLVDIRVEFLYCEKEEIGISVTFPLTRTYYLYLGLST